MYLIKFIALCFGGAFIGASLFHMRFEKTIALFLMGIMVVLYQAYILDIVQICSIGIMAGMVVGGIFGIVRVVQNRNWKSVLNKLFTPMAIIYIIILCMIWNIVRFNRVGLIDELHLWAALPKILFFEKGRQQLTASILLGYNDYIPGMPLFLYFLEFVNGSFSEALLYFGYTAIGNIVLMNGMFEKFKSWRRWYLIPGVSVTVFLLPLMYYNNLFHDYTIYYKSIHVDAALGIFVAYATWLLGKKSWKQTGDALCFSLSLTVIVLLKSSGIMFVAIIGLGAFFYVVIRDQKYIKRMLWILAIPVTAYLEWTIILKRKEVELTMADYSLADIFSKKYLGKFWELLCRKELIYHPQMPELGKMSSFMVIFTILCTFSLLVCRMIKNSYISYVTGVMIFQVVVFTAGVYGLIAGPFQGQELSYGRYICTAFTAFQCYLAMVLFHNVLQIKKEWLHKKRNVLLLGVPVLVLFILFPKIIPQAISYPLPALQDADRVEALINNTIITDKKDKKRILLTMEEKYNSFSPDLYLYFWRRLYFDLIDENQKIESCIFIDKDIYTVENQEGIEMHLLNGGTTGDFDYIYRVNYKDETEKEVEFFEVKDKTEREYYLEFIERKTF